MKSIFYFKPFHSLLISFSVVTMGLSLPAYNTLLANQLYLPSSKSFVLLTMLSYQLVPVVPLFVLDRAILRFTRGMTLLRAYRTMLFVFAILLLLREAQISFLSPSPPWIQGLPLYVKYGVAFVIFPLVIFLSIYAYRFVSLWFIYLAPVAILLTGVFMSQIFLFNLGWTPKTIQPPQALPQRSEVPIFIIVLDEMDYSVLLKDGAIDQQKFPNFAALAGDSVFFTNATSNWDYSHFAFPTLLTGRFLFSKDDLNNLASWSILNKLAGTFDIRVYEEYFDHCFGAPGSCRSRFYGRPQQYLALVGFNIFLRLAPPPITNLVWDRSTIILGRLTQGDHFNVFLNDIKAEQARGSFYFFHSRLPHVPYIYDEEGGIRTRLKDFYFSSEIKTEEDFSRVFENYRRQVQYVDKLLGRFMAKLRTEGLYNKAIIVITSDHGIRPRQFSVYALPVPEELPDYIPHVPLFIKAPGLSPQVSDIDYQHIDLVPTLLDILGMPRREDLLGVSAFAFERPAREKVFYLTKGPESGLKAPYFYDPQSGTWRLSPNYREGGPGALK